LKLTNYKGLPEPIVEAILHDSYSAGDADISVTSLINSPRVVALTKRYADEIEQDASDMIWLLLGKSIHEILHQANISGIVEQRLYMDVDGWRLSGQFDRLEYIKDQGLLLDFKITSTYTVRNHSRIEDYSAQLNVYKRLLEINGYKIDHLEIVAILRDWRMSERATVENYPEHQVAMIPIEVWPAEKADAYIRERISLHKAAKVALPFCTDEDRWAQGEKWALMKKGRQRAIKLYPYRELAMLAAREASDLYVEHRPGRFARCEAYCPVASKCLAPGTMVQLTHAEIEARDALK